MQNELLTSPIEKYPIVLTICPFVPVCLIVKLFCAALLTQRRSLLCKESASISFAPGGTMDDNVLPTCRQLV